MIVLCVASSPLSAIVVPLSPRCRRRVVAARRAVQLSERVTVTWDRIASRNILGPRYTLALKDVTGVTEDDRTALIAFRGGRVLELSPWLEGRFWLARELRARFGR